MFPAVRDWPEAMMTSLAGFIANLIARPVGIGVSGKE
jgi:hypothetical protein